MIPGWLGRSPDLGRSLKTEMGYGFSRYLVVGYCVGVNRHTTTLCTPEIKIPIPSECSS